MSETPVVFRKFSDDEVVALFPAMPGWRLGECMSYLHLWQHGAADYGHAVRTTRPTRPEDHADLQAELVQIGYDDLRVYQREQQWMHRARIDAHVEITRPRGGTTWTTAPTCPI